MKNLIVIFTILSLFFQCQTNKALQTPQLMKSEIQETPKSNYFIGNWALVESYTINENSKTKNPENICQKESYWKFFMEKAILKQSKYTAKGSKCSEFSITKSGRVELAHNEMHYFTDDVLYTATINILSENKFSVTNKDFIKGKTVEIVSVFQKK